jgi:bud site selection protein 31
VENETHEGKSRGESAWKIFRIHHQQSRYVFDLFYRRHAISRELYEYLLKEGYADKNLIAKWKKVRSPLPSWPSHAI